MTLPLNPAPNGPTIVIPANPPVGVPDGSVTEPQMDSDVETPAGTPDSGPIQFKSQAELDKVIQERVARERKKTIATAEERDKLALRVQELEPLEAATQTDTQRWEKEKQKMAQENAELTAWKAQRERDDLVRGIAETEGLPSGFLNRVTGDTPEEIEADVKSLLGALKDSGQGKPPAGKPAEPKKPASKATPGSGGESDDDSLPSPSEMAQRMRATSGQPYFSKN